jgi:hypothetical protein
MPAIPNGEPSFMAMASGCLTLCPLVAFHLKNPSTGRMRRHFRYASRNVDSRATASAFALIGLRPPVGSLHQ